MVARDLTRGTVTDPVARDKDGKVDEPHIGAVVNDDPPPKVVQTGFVRGGTTNPPEGEDGSVQRLDNDGKPVKGRKAEETKG